MRITVLRALLGRPAFIASVASMTIASARAGAPVKLNAPLIPPGDVASFRVGAGGTRVVYLADPITDGQFELFGVDTIGGLVTRLNGTLEPGHQVTWYDVASAGSHVAFCANQLAGGPGLRGVPIDGGSPTALGGDAGSCVAGPAGTDSLYVTSDGARVVHRCVAASWYGNTILCSSAITGGSTVELNPFLPAGRSVSTDSVVLGPAGTSTIAFLADGTSTSASLHAGDVVTGTTGMLVPCTGACQQSYRFTPNGAWLIEHHPGTTGELWSTSVSGDPALRLNAAGSRVDRFAISPVPVAGAYRVAFGQGPQLGDPDEFPLHVNPVSGGPPLRLAGHSARRLEFSPDGSKLVFIEVEPDGDEDLLVVPALGGSVIHLGDDLVSGGDVTDFRIAADGGRVVYRADLDADEVFELYSVPLGGGPSRKLNGPLVAGGDVSATFLISADSRTVVYLADQVRDGQTELFAVPIAGGVSRRLNGPLPLAGDVLEDVALTPGVEHAVYRANQDALDRVELYAVEVDPDGDGDGVPLSLDCDDDDPGVWAVPGEVADLRLTHAGNLGGTTTLSWAGSVPPGGISPIHETLRAPVRSAFRIPGPAITTLDSGTDASSTDAQDPAPIFYYLVRARNTCGTGSAGDGQDTVNDGDGDGSTDGTDNCPDTPNPGQADLDGDGVGDACDWIQGVFDFENGPGGWTHASRGAADTWHVDGEGCFGHALGSSMFVSDGNAGPSCIVDSTHEHSQLLSPPIDLPSGTLTLTFDALSFDEAGTCVDGAPFDAHDVGITTDGGATYALLNDCTPLVDGTGVPIHHAFDVSAWAGQRVRIIFVYDTVDFGFGHTFAVDNVNVERAP